MPARLYADNAATSFPKPPEVLEAVQAYALNIGAAAGRGAYREALQAGEILADCRRRLARLFGAESPNEIIFTPNGSVALNQAIKGTLQSGDHVVTTSMEHNSVLRPLNALETQIQIQTTHVRADSDTGRVDCAPLLAALRPNTRMIAVVHANNVTGTLNPVAQIGAEARRRGILFLVDAAQTAGHVPIDVREMNIDLLATPGHKGLMGPLGTGMLYIRRGLETQMRPLVEGGTGSAGERPFQPDFMPDKFEAGNHNAPGLAGLSAALAWIEHKTVSALRQHDQDLAAHFLDRVADLPGFKVYATPNADERVAVFSVCLAGLDPTELSALLDAEFDVMTRAGMHCAPLAHKTIGTDAGGGTTRLSFGPYTTTTDVDRCADALATLARAQTHV